MLSNLKQTYRAIEPTIVVIFLLYIIGVGWFPQVAVYESETVTSAIPSNFNNPLTIINLFLYGFTFFSLLINWQQCLRAITKDKALIGLVILALLSIAWSADVVMTLTNIRAMIRTTAFAVYIGARFNIKEQMGMVNACLLVSAILSLLMCLLIPSQGVQISWGQVDGWRGVFFHKNILGRSMAFGSGAWLLTAWKERDNKWFAWSAFLLCFVMLVLSNSKTGLVSFLFILPLFPFNKINKQKTFGVKMLLLHLASLIVGGVAIVGATSYEPILTALGKDPTLTGRVPLWTLMWEKIIARPFLGYGYYGFWTSPDGEDIKAVLGWAGHAHNGFFEIALATGVVGLSLVLVNYIQNYRRSIAYAQDSSDLRALWPAQVFTILFFVNMTLGCTFLAIEFAWIFHVSIGLSLADYFHQKNQEKRINQIRSREELVFSYLDK